MILYRFYGRYLNYILNYIRAFIAPNNEWLLKKVLTITKGDPFFGTGEPDEEGEFDGSNLKFEINILNKKIKT